MKPQGIYKANKVLVKSVYNCVAEYNICNDVVVEYYLVSVIEDCLRASTEECRLRVFENRVLRRICGPRRDEVTGEWSRLHNEKLNDLYYSSNCGPGSSVGIADNFGLDGRGLNPGGDEIFRSSQTCPGAHQASCKLGTVSFPGVKCGRGVLPTTHLLLVPPLWKSRAIPLPTLWATPGL